MFYHKYLFCFADSKEAELQTKLDNERKSNRQLKAELEQLKKEYSAERVKSLGTAEQLRGQLDAERELCHKVQYALLHRLGKEGLIFMEDGNTGKHSIPTMEPILNRFYFINGDIVCFHITMW